MKSNRMATVASDECGKCGRVLGAGDCYGCENDRLRAEFLAYVERTAPTMCAWDLPQHAAGKAFARPDQGKCNCNYHAARTMLDSLRAGHAAPQNVGQFTRYAAIRYDAAGDEYIDLSTLSDTSEGALGIAVRTDERNHRAIRHREMRGFARIARVKIEEA